MGSGLRTIKGGPEEVSDQKSCREELWRAEKIFLTPLFFHDPNVPFDRQAYWGRCVAEQCVGWLKEFRRIGTRFEKLAVNFHGMLQLAIIKWYLRLLF
jgi:transposase